jgi:hypothetical protein
MKCFLPYLRFFQLLCRWTPRGLCW